MKRLGAFCTIIKPGDNNCCPTRFGDCRRCEYIGYTTDDEKIVISGVDYDAYKRVADLLKEEENI